jgi:uncharacterized protein
MTEGSVITVNSRKHDGSIQRQWQCDLISAIDNEIVLKGEFSSTIEHAALGIIARGTVSYEYFWTDRWYNVFRFHGPTGELRNYYCNISAPPTISADVLDYIDLDIDVVVWPNGSHQILDLEEFEENSVSFGYPPEVLSKASESLAELLSLIRSARLPT